MSSNREIICEVIREEVCDVISNEQTKQDEKNGKEDSENNNCEEDKNEEKSDEESDEEKENDEEENDEEENDKEENDEEENDEEENDEENKEEEKAWTESEDEQIRNDVTHIQYSDRYSDDINKYTYRHVILPPSIYNIMPKGRLMNEKEWRSLGVQQSKGWEHYSIYRKTPKVLLFRRPTN